MPPVRRLILVASVIAGAGCQEPVSESASNTQGVSAPADSKPAIHSPGNEPIEGDNKAAPDLVLSKIDGSGTVSLSENEGKVVLVDLWATWCVPCIAELPHLQDLAILLGKTIS